MLNDLLMTCYGANLNLEIADETARVHRWGGSLVDLIDPDGRTVERSWADDMPVGREGILRGMGIRLATLISLGAPFSTPFLTARTDCLD
jgi:hypothetical protein